MAPCSPQWALAFSDVSYAEVHFEAADSARNQLLQRGREVFNMSLLDTENGQSWLRQF